MPGYLNTIPYNGSYMSNWWQFLADWDSYNYLTADLFQSNNHVPSTTIVGPCAKCQDNLNITPHAYAGIYEAKFTIQSDANIQQHR